MNQGIILNIINSTFGLSAIIFFPFLSFLILGLSGIKSFKKYASFIGIISILATFILSSIVALEYFFISGKTADGFVKITALNFEWLKFSESISLNVGILLDPISVMMILIVSFISLMVHIFSAGYMKDDKRIKIYYSFLSLFTFSMLGLVVSTNIFQMYIFWELVGVSSFLLIGYYYQKPEAVAAAKKAFIVTRFADLGFLIGILIISYYSQSLDFVTIIERLTGESQYLNSSVAVSFLGVSALTWALVLIFIGGAGKSAMFPLHIWLPDAMEGPTPVSALIHAATMVVAGVFLVARLFPVYSLSCPAALDVVAFTGVFTALFAALIACTQTDIKRVLAYSTISQIGFMIFSLGISGYGGESGLGYMASMFHLFTHAMFKALLFLGAGVVIHYIHSNEVKDMGGLRKQLPITNLCFLFACLAISGIPPFSGFFSKEEILLAAWNSNKTVFFIALFTAFLTAFYMFRLYFLIFWHNKPSNSKSKAESHFSMIIPLLVLAVLTIITGFVPFGNLITSDGKILHSHFHFSFSIIPIIVAIAGIMLSAILFKTKSNKTENLNLENLLKPVKNKFYIDEIYIFITRKLVFSLVAKPAAWFDKNIIDGTVNYSGELTGKVSEKIKTLHSGKTQGYALWFVLGLIILVLVFAYIFY
ncbi:MAG: NADH-quinone oxidoreductase subunit L [Bacteroidetes bacterium]|nr:NADH-quinone oxidoreductase subunit L [Bacteroidota bacterium]